jgi:tight adherence protein C
LTFLYVGYTELSRAKKLDNFGLKTKEKASKAQASLSALETINNYLGSVLSSSDKELKAKLNAAGLYNDVVVKLFMPLKYLTLIVGNGAFFIFYYLGSLTQKEFMIFALLYTVVVLLLPDAYVSIKANAMRKKLSGQLPYLIDMMGICVQTGMTIEAALSYLAHEMISFDPDIAKVLQETSDKATVVGLEAALDDLYVKIPTPEFRSFVMTLNQSLQYGSSISNVLTTLATDIREVQMLTLEERIGSLSAKMSVPLILFIMIPIVILITAPGIMRIMS